MHPPFENEQARRVVIFEIDMYIYVTQTRVYALFLMKRLISQQSNQTKLPLLPSSWCECAFGEWSSPTMYSESENAFPPTPVSFARSAAARTAALRRSFASSFSSTDERFSPDAAKDGCAMVNPPIATVVAATSATPEVGRILRTTSRRLLACVARSSSSRASSLPLCLLCCLLNASFPSRVTSAALLVVIPPPRMGERVVRR